MESHSDKEKSTKISRDDRDRDHKHRSRDKDRDRDHHRRPSDRDSRREYLHHRSSSSRRDDREGSRDRESRRERSGSIDRRDERERSRDPRGGREAKRERSYEERESDDVERESKKKRKEREVEVEDLEEEEEEGAEREKRVRVSERRRFDDNKKVKEEESKMENIGNNFSGSSNNNNTSGNRVDGMSEIKVKEEVMGEAIPAGGTANGSPPSQNGAAVESFAKTSSFLPTSVATHSLTTKVYSIPNTNENKGVSIIGSHEVPGKSSTDGASAAAGKSGNLSLDALAKAKQALLKHKGTALEKLKKIPLLSKGGSSSSESSAPSSATGAVHGLVPLTTSTTIVSPGVVSSPSTLAASVASSHSVNQPEGGPPSLAGLAGTPNYEAVRRAQELAAKMGFRQDPQFGPLYNLFPGQIPADVMVPQKPTKAPVLRVDALGREIDEHGNVVNVTKPSNLSTLKVNINKQKKEAFQILKPEFEDDPESNPHYDPRMGINKNKILRPKRSNFEFVEEGKWSKDAEDIKLKNQFGMEKAKDIKARQALHAKAKAAPDINPNLIEVAERVITKGKPLKEPIPEIEWWDEEILLLPTYGEIDGGVAEEQLKIKKITIYVEHPKPIEPPAEPAPPPPQPLKLTKKEQKKLRTQRRLAREKDKQEMIRQGLIEPPKPKVKMSNLMKVLGSEATQDPTRLEKEIRTAAAEREQAHIDRNIARKLTPAERREKKERKLFDDPNTLETIVSVYKINDLSHKKTLFKVQMNARENRLTGCCVMSEGISVVVVEGGSKSIKRYGKLILRRINWAEAVNEEDDDDDGEKPVNRCVLVWQGSVAKPSFSNFQVHDQAVTEAAARKVFADAGVSHYWDLAVNFSDDQV